MKMGQLCFANTSVLMYMSVDVFGILQWVVGLSPPQWKVTEQGGKLWGE